MSDGNGRRVSDQGEVPTPTRAQDDAESIGELVFQISDRASVLIREEIELAKTEVSEKINRLLTGSVVGLVAGIFVLLALAMIMHGVAWLLNDLFFEDNVWAGFLVEAAFFLLLAAIGGLIAYRSFKQGAPPTPDMAIEEAKEIKAAFDGNTLPTPNGARESAGGDGAKKEEAKTPAAAQTTEEAE